ncbi:MAG: sigma-54-dependent transcriptional regulator [Planctomycetota bacterium]|jgi:DNA-binding NtrC family response regulator
MKNFEILFVDDDEAILNMIDKYLTGEGYNVRLANSAMKALELLKQKYFDIVFTDFKMPEMDGLELLSAIKEYRPETEVIIITGHGTMKSAIQAMKIGSYDYLQKPFKLDILKLIIDRIIEDKRLQRERVLLKTRVKERHRYDKLVGASLEMQEIYEIIDRMKNTSPNVLLEGESGTGKELTAHVTHMTSDRRNKPLVPIKCHSLLKGIPKKKTRAHFAQLFESSAGGTLYLDEIADLPNTAQTEFLKALRYKGGAGAKGTESEFDIRIIAATNKDIKELIERGDLTRDFFKHVNVISIKLPPLRARKEDICLLIGHFLEKFNAKARKKILNVSQVAMDYLLGYHWPGNVIQLENVIERAFALGVELTINVADLPDEIKTFGEISKIS